MHLISNAELRKQLVDTHSSFQTLFSAYKSNNISLEELDEINRLISQKHESAKELGEVVTERMARYSASIKTAHDRTKTATAKVEELLNR